MKYDYLVKHNGVYYPAGTDVPVDKPVVKSAEPKVETVSSDDEQEETEQQSVVKPRSRRK